jgi:hypothetical protein
MSGVVIDESGNVQQWTAVYWRYHSRYQDEFDNFAEAFEFLKSGEDYGNLSSESILGPDGAVLMDKQALWDAQCSDVNPDDLLVKLSTPAEIGGAA